MSGNPDPIDLIDGLNSADDVSKSETRAELKAIVRQWATCSEVRSLDLSARSRIMIGSRFFRKDTSDTSADDMTETSLVVIDGAGTHWLVIEGERYDMPFSFTGQFGDSEKLNAIAVVTPLELPAGLPGSLAFGMVIPTAQTVVTFERSLDSGATWTALFTVTFAIGSRAGVFALVADATLANGSLLRPAGQATHDATFAGFTATIAALR